MRNSSLVEGLCAENVAGLKPAAEAVVPMNKVSSGGRGASPGRRSSDVSRDGAQGSENAGMSSVKPGEKPDHRKPKVSYATFFDVGLVGPKP